MEFKEIEIDDQEIMTSYFEKRYINSCEYNFTTLMIWNERYEMAYSTTDDFMLIMEAYEGDVYGLMPVCSEENFEKGLKALQNHFDTIGKPLKIYVSDETFANYVQEVCSDCYKVTTNRDEYDYLYEADKLRNLSGKKLRKKRNHINAFLRDYEGRWTYRELGIDDEAVILEYFNEWYASKDVDDEMLDQELKGIKKVINHIDLLDVKMGGIFIDGDLKGFTIASFANEGEMGIIHVEKADASIRGLYPMLNQQFLQETLTEVKVVNREDDVGDPGLRKSKLSYYPMGFAKKYTIIEVERHD